MAMEIVIARPPNYQDIIAAFPYVHKMHGVYFSWGKKIYNPDGVEIEPHVKAHENVHGQRQLVYPIADLAGGPFGLSQNDDAELHIRAWWARYFIDVPWRYNEELVAHKAEYRSFLGANQDRRLREQVLASCAQRLSGELYGNLVSYTEARRAIRG